MGVVYPRTKRARKFQNARPLVPVRIARRDSFLFLSISCLFGIKRCPRLSSVQNQPSIVSVHFTQLAHNCGTDMAASAAKCPAKVHELMLRVEPRPCAWCQHIPESIICSS